jgi:hypothetical protein
MSLVAVGVDDWVACGDSKSLLCCPGEIAPLPMGTGLGRDRMPTGAIGESGGASVVA